MPAVAIPWEPDRRGQAGASLGRFARRGRVRGETGRGPGDLHDCLMASGEEIFGKYCRCPAAAMVSAEISWY